VFPAVEDFGMSVKAMACGTPVLANSVDGERETVEAVGGGVTCNIDRATDWEDLIHQARRSPCHVKQLNSTAPHRSRNLLNPLERSHHDERTRVAAEELH
jgi:glycosyltransferase involved in cell wall biosynthesis